MNSTLREASLRLQKAGICSPANEARLLQRAARNMGMDFMQALSMRERRQPFSHIISARNFWKNDFKVDGQVLDPRPESETLIEAALNLVKNGDIAEAPDILDLGTGSGCLLLSLLNEWPQATGLGVDISADALKCARVNAGNLGVAERADFLRSDWFAKIHDRFDLIICNPPYVAQGEADTLAPEVVFWEPEIALFSGVDGYDSYRHIIPRASDYLKEYGWIMMEVGAGQAANVHCWLQDAGFSELSTIRDLGRVDRVVLGKKN